MLAPETRPKTSQRHRQQQRQRHRLRPPALLRLGLGLLLVAAAAVGGAGGSRYNRQNHVMYASAGGGHQAPPLEPGYRHGKHGSTGSSNSNNNNNNNNDVYSVADSQAMTDDYMSKFSGGGSPAQGADHTPNIVHQQQQQQQQQLSSCQTVCACKWKGGKQTVECINRLLIQIPDNIDPSTQVLDMSGNKLQTLSNEQFVRANLLNLQKLYLRNCKIGEIERETFKGLTNLVELDLSQNLLVVVPSLALSYISSLRELTLASNHIHKIDSNSFAITPALHKLDLSHCDIQTIAPQAFEGLEGLTLLRLNGNKLSELLPKTIETLSHLHGIELHDNPWMCDCRLRDAKLWLTNRNIPYPVDPVCAGGPERVINRTFDDLHLNDFACRPEMLPISHYVEATMGENASIVCRAKAVPAAVIKWYWNGRLLANNSAFSTFQRVHVFEQEERFEKRSRLVLTNAQEADSGEFYCVADNRAGSAEANFTLHVSMRAAGMASLGSGQIVGLSAALVVLILCVLLVIMFLLMRLKRQPYFESKTPNHLEVITSVNHQNSMTNKTQPAGGNGLGGVVIANGALPNCLAGDGHDRGHDRGHGHGHGTLERKASGEARGGSGSGSGDSKHTNPVQKPPRLTDLPYSTSGYDNGGSVLSTAPCFISPTASAGNNPDLINDTKRFGSDEFADLKIPAILTANLGGAELGGCGSSGEYSRAGGCDSLYPSGLWEHAPAGTSSADDLYLKRYSDKTPIMEAGAASHQAYDLHERASNADCFSKTFPRMHYSMQQAASPTPGGGGSAGGINNPSTSSTAALLGAHSTTSTATATTNLSLSNSSGGYPMDYGLPLVPGAEHQHNHHLQMHPLAQLHQLAANNNNANLNGSSGSPGGPSGPSGPSNNNHFSSRTLPRLHDSSSSPASSRSGSTPTPPPATGALSNGHPVNAKTIRVWQKGGVPVLPPVTALKRALISSSRNSPDEGYQEGCGTDV